MELRLRGCESWPRVSPIMGQTAGMMWPPVAFHTPLERAEEGVFWGGLGGMKGAFGEGLGRPGDVPWLQGYLQVNRDLEATIYGGADRKF